MVNLLNSIRVILRPDFHESVHRSSLPAGQLCAEPLKNRKGNRHGKGAGIIVYRMDSVQSLPL